jgi:Sec-independent protein secretion pathway component TatC
MGWASRKRLVKVWKGVVVGAFVVAALLAAED